MTERTLTSKRLVTNCNEEGLTTSATICNRFDFDFVLEFIKKNEAFKVLFKDIEKDPNNKYYLDMEVKLKWRSK